MRMRARRFVTLALCCAAAAVSRTNAQTRPDSKSSASAPSRVDGWLNWRGPEQNGLGHDNMMPDRRGTDAVSPLWTYDLAGRGTPLVAGDRVYVLGYRGQKADLQEVLVCLDAASGKPAWDHAFGDFLSDNAYDRYSIGSPVIDPATGNVFVQTSAGIFAALNPEGKLLWQHSMMEEFGRLTFPNGRTGSPVIEGDLVITRGLTSNWGAQGAGADRFYAFEKATGRPVWASQPGVVPPKDNSFSTPVVQWLGDRRVFYVGTGDGCVVCVNARTGEPIWQYKISAGGVNASVVITRGARPVIIAGHADENVDSSEIGRMVAIDLMAVVRQLAAPPRATAPATQAAATAPAASSGPRVLDRSCEAWRLDVPVLTSSPVVGYDASATTRPAGRVYQVTKTGDLLCIDPDAGKVLWHQKLGQDQLHASPLVTHGRLYVPLWHEGLYILQPGNESADVVAKIPLEGEVLGAPALSGGRLYVITTAKLYCFGSAQGKASPPGYNRSERFVEEGPVTQIQVVPNEVLLRPGQKAALTLRGLDANGQFVRELKNPTWRKFIPPTALVKSEMDASVNDANELVAAPGAKLSAGQFEATAEGVKGYVRGRVMPDLPFNIDFENFDLGETHKTEAGVKFAYPPLPWIGARFKFEVRELEGSKVLAKTLDNIFFQRALAFVGPPGLSNYTIEADVRSEGNRRGMSAVGVINQRYIIALQGNSQELEVSSNYDRIKAGVPFAWKPDAWYRLKTRVDVAADGSGVVRAKAWKKGDAEPEAWMIEVPHKKAHAEGAPGLYAFAPSARYRVFIDNVAVTPNNDAAGAAAPPNEK